MTTNKQIWWVVLTVISIAGGYYAFLYDKSVEPLSDKSQIFNEERVPDVDALAKELMDRYHATEFDFNNFEYTFQAQEKLVTGEPVFFDGA